MDNNYNPYHDARFLSSMESSGFQITTSADGRFVTLSRGDDYIRTIDTETTVRRFPAITSLANTSNHGHVASSGFRNNHQPCPGSGYGEATASSNEAYYPSRHVTHPSATATTTPSSVSYYNYQYGGNPRIGVPATTANETYDFDNYQTARTGHASHPTSTSTQCSCCTRPYSTTTPSRYVGYSYHDSAEPTAANRYTSQPDNVPPPTTTPTSSASTNNALFFTPESSFSSQASFEASFREEQKRCHCGCDAIDFCEDCYSLDCHHVLLSWGIEEPRPPCIRQLEAANSQSSPPPVRSVDSLKRFSVAAQLEEMRQSSLDASSSGIQLISSGVKVSLLCPITMKRMVHPARLEACEHLQCFDAQSVLQVKDQKNTAELRCPVCRTISVEESSVLLNELTENILKDVTTKNAKSVVIRADGTWTVEGSRDSELASSLNGLTTSSNTSGGNRRMIIDVESNTTLMESDTD